VTLGDVNVADLAGESLRALAGISLHGRVGHADFEQGTRIPGTFVNYHFAMIARVTFLAIAFHFVFVTWRYETHYISGHGRDLRRIKSDLVLAVAVEAVTFVAL